ncbi:hypothetical protein GC176_20615 [bacterium]|nr:hypothetical protein [bacterium]
MKLTIQRLFTLLIVAVAGCGSTEPDTTQIDNAVFVDTVTQTAMVLPVSDTVPAINPHTGKRTLMPALFCPDCQKWYPVPAPEQINRQPDAARCPRTETPLIADGPWPGEEAQPAGNGS